MRHALSLALLACAAILTSGSAQPAPDSLSIEDAISRAIQQHPTVQQAREAIEAARARVGLAQSDLYPSADASGVYVRLGPVPQFELEGRTLKLAPENNYDAHITIHTKVYDFGRRTAAIDVAEANVQWAEENARVTAAGLAFQTAQSFYAILFHRQSVEVQRQQIDALSAHLDAATKRVTAGTATDFDLLTTRVRVASAQNALADLQNRQRQQELVLQRLLGVPPGEQVAVRGDFSVMTRDLNIDSMVTLATRTRAEVQAARYAELTAELQYRAACLDSRPSVSVDLNGGVKNGYEPDLNKLKANWSGVLQARVPIFDGYRTRSREQDALAALRGARYRTIDVTQMIETEVHQAVEDERSSIDRLRDCEVLVHHAEAAVDIARARYESGVVTNLELIDAETALAQARLQHLEAQYRVVMARLAMERATGTLLPS